MLEADSTGPDRAALQRLDQHAPVAEAADAHAPDQTVVRRIAHVVVEDEPIVEQRAERMAADLHRDRRRLRVERRVDVVERPLAVGVEMRDRAGADIADQRRARAAAAAAADEPRRLDAEIFGDDRDFVGPQAAVAVEKIGDCGRRAAERLGEAAAGFAGPFQAGADPIDGQS